MQQAVFIDRDGVITRDPPHFAHRPDQMQFNNGSIEAIKRLNKNNFKVVVVSNQSGIAYGYFIEQEADRFHRLMTEELALYNAKIDAIYYCPHHPNAKVKRYRLNCDCRKPHTGMFEKAAKELNIDLKNSFMVGDRKTDIDAGNASGCKTILVLTGHGLEEFRNNTINYNHVASNLLRAVDYILHFSKTINIITNRKT